MLCSYEGHLGKKNDGQSCAHTHTVVFEHHAQLHTHYFALRTRTPIRTPHTDTRTHTVRLSKLTDT